PPGPDALVQIVRAVTVPARRGHAGGLRLEEQHNARCEPHRVREYATLCWRMQPLRGKDRMMPTASLPRRGYIPCAGAHNRFDLPRPGVRYSEPQGSEYLTPGRTVLKRSCGLA